MAFVKLNITGLNDQQVIHARTSHGTNKLQRRKSIGIIESLKDVFTEPMFIFLAAAAAIYFIIGDVGDGIFMTVSIVVVSAISFYQEVRSKNALKALEHLSEPFSQVIRNGTMRKIKSDDIVLGDFVIVEEGASIPADGRIVQSNDFSVNESVLTGESFPVAKNETDNPVVFRGTVVVTGLAICEVIAIGNQTRIGQLGDSLQAVKKESTPLQIQIEHFVKRMAWVGAIVFVLVWAIHFFKSQSVLDSFLKALTLAMSILPEEIPVAFTTFMALGAWRLTKLGVIIKQTKTVETLGSATVICTDKTGTITENRMTLARLFTLSRGNVTPEETAAAEVIRLAMWASEPIPFDPMEVALHKAYEKLDETDLRHHYRMIHEYPLGGKPPMMTHIFQDNTGHRIIAAKGAAEAIVAVSMLSDADKEKVKGAVRSLSAEGFRVLGVSSAVFEGDHFPQQQQEFRFTFAGLVAFYDPPKKNIRDVFEAFQKAGIDVKIITGDNAETTATIAREVGLVSARSAVKGDDVMRMNDDQLKIVVRETSIFSRMFPEAKLKVIHALKAQGHVVAMTGDGVNDGPALKAAHIGIAMGKKGTEIAKQASSLILTEDDLAKMVDAIAMGRKIYTNLKKAIQYIISIHIPIILTVFLPLALGWIYPAIFSPVHVILLELIMGPTCSIVYENEPMERNIMLQPPRPFTRTFFNAQELATSIIQGLAITIGTLGVYRFSVENGWNENTTRALVFITLMSANVFLTLVNRSFYYSVFATLRYRNALIPVVITVVVVLGALLLLAPWFNDFFQFERISVFQFLIALIAGFASVIWFEGIKWWRRKKRIS